MIYIYKNYRIYTDTKGYYLRLSPTGFRVDCDSMQQAKNFIDFLTQ